jgi:hypothetical protein
MLRRIGLTLGLLIVLPYAIAPVYDFPEPAAFSGSSFLNPYANLTHTWQRANLHAHGRAWGGLTSGEQPSDVVARRYRSMGYSVPGVSNYHQIAAHKGVATMPIYEHGYNIGKMHQLAIGARRVEWLDFPLWPTLSQQQLVIDQVAEHAELVALAHPPSRDAYTPRNLNRLTGYHLIEIINGPFRSEEAWDAALSSGRAVWAVGNDDTHDLNNLRRTAVAWTMIDAATPSTHDVIAALRAGRSYAVMRTNEIASAVETTLADVQFEDGRLTVTCDGEPSTFLFIGQNGAVHKTVQDTLRAEYTFQPMDTYVRTVIRAPRTAMYLNPVLRHAGSSFTPPAATVDTAGTWLLRGASATAGCLLLYAMRERRRPIRLRPESLIPRTDRETA